MALLTEGKNIGDVLKYEEENDLSRKQVRLLSGSLNLGAVVGFKSPDVSSTAGGTNTGNGTLGAVTLGRLALPGNYVLTCKTKQANAGVFSVVTPKGEALADLTVAVAYAGDHINVTLSDGATDFEVGDKFTIAVSGHSEILEHNPAGTDGSQFAAGVLIQALDASSAAVDGVAIVRNAIVADKGLVWKTGMTAPQKATAIAQLEALGILVRSAA